LILIAAGAIALAQSWNRWCDPVIDVGRDLYVPQALLHGTKLYSGILYYYPPLAPYLLAAITRVTGHTLLAYTSIGIAQSAVVAALLYAIARRLAGRWSALAASLAFVTISMCGASTWGANWIFPYAHAATFGMTFLLAFFACVVFDRPALGVAFALAASWCKIDFFVAAVIVIAALYVAGKLRLRHVATYVIAFAATVVLAVAIFGAANLRANIFPASLLGTARAARFYSIISGGAWWRESIGQGLLALGVITAIALLIRLKLRAAALAVALIAGLVAPVIGVFFRAAGLLQWASLFFRRRDPWLFALGALSVATTLRIALNVTISWYGFVLVVPMYLLIAYVARTEVIWLALLVVLSMRGLAEERTRFAAKQYPIVTKQGVLFDVNEPRAKALNDLLPMLHGSVAVFPEGLTINYFAGVPTTLRYQTFTPVETADPAVEADIIRDLAAHSPEQIVMLTRDVHEFGSRGFGIDYNQRVVAYIREHYAVERTWGGPKFELALLTSATNAARTRPTCCPSPPAPAPRPR
jgi:hypothetical protein